MWTSAHFRDVLALAFADYRHQWRVSVCFILALAAVLAPLLILFGLKFGIVSSMLDQLVLDPRNREIRTVGSGDYDSAWFARMRETDGVAFVMPRTRTLAASMKLSAAGGGNILDVELIPSGEGDPSLEGQSPPPNAIDEVVLAANTSRKLGGIAAGAEITGYVTRLHGGNRERVEIALKVIGVAPERAFTRDALFVPLSLLTAVEDYRDGKAVARLNWSGDPPGDAAPLYPGFRLYAAELDDVLRLRDGFNKLGIDVRTHAADIDVVRSLDRNLSLVFWIIALVGTVGFSMSLGASLWADVDRKRRDLSVLRLVGFRRGDVVWFPVLQGLFTAIGGWVLAVLIYLGLEALINDLFADKVRVGAEVCRLLPWHHLAALGFTLICAMLAAALGGLRAGRIEPSEGLRDV
ncbi:MAG: ABC transporter permease [Gammaproteobacteria bacterium]|nr:ABC transporter permease [Gammaproteobacteria bacterium]MCP5137221.1 ABC transporter permease [Gammaproteobacteria bacterium]